MATSSLHSHLGESIVLSGAAGSEVVEELQVPCHDLKSKKIKIRLVELSSQVEQSCIAETATVSNSIIYDVRDLAVQSDGGLVNDK